MRTRRIEAGRARLCASAADRADAPSMDPTRVEAADPEDAPPDKRGVDEHQDEPEAGGETNPPPNVGVRPYRPTNTKDQVAP